MAARTLSVAIPSKIGTVPGPMVLVKGYPRTKPPVGTAIEYAEATRTSGGRWIHLPGYPWKRGYVTRYTLSGHICIDHEPHPEEAARYAAIEAMYPVSPPQSEEAKA